MILLIASCWVAIYAGFAAYSIDTSTYYLWSKLVPLGYPFFLSAIRDLTLVPAIQLTLLCAALLLLCIALNRISRVAGLAALLLLLCYVKMFNGAFQLVSEGLFLPLLLVNVGAAIFMIVEPERRAWPLLVAISAAAMMFVRPAGYYAALGIVFLLIALRARWRYLAKWMLLPFVLCLMLTLVTNFAVRGNATQSQIGRVLFAHSAFIFDARLADQADRDLAIKVEETLKSHREKYDRAQSALERYSASMNDYNSRIDAVERIIALDRSLVGNPFAFRELEAVQLRFFRHIVLNRPLDYLGLVADQVAGAWQTSIMSPFDLSLEVREQGEVIELRRREIARYKIPFDERWLAPDPQRFSGLAGKLLKSLGSVYYFLSARRVLLYIAGALSLLAIPVSLFFANHRLIVIAYCGVMIHGAVLLTCFTTVFIPRYAWPIDPVLLVASVLILEAVFNLLVRLKSARRLPA
ncbi:MAG TPA: hypothetical protein VLR92_11970 [Blastocatellia bacterium]|nr:hypothetical protein [Blastocatellia bacterium]